LVSLKGLTLLISFVSNIVPILAALVIGVVLGVYVVFSLVVFLVSIIAWRAENSINQVNSTTQIQMDVVGSKAIY